MLHTSLGVRGHAPDPTFEPVTATHQPTVAELREQLKARIDTLDRAALLALTVALAPEDTDADDAPATSPAVMTDAEWEAAIEAGLADMRAGRVVPLADHVAKLRKYEAH